MIVSCRVSEVHAMCVNKMQDISVYNFRSGAVAFSAYRKRRRSGRRGETWHGKTKNPVRTTTKNPATESLCAICHGALCALCVGFSEEIKILQIDFFSKKHPYALWRTVRSARRLRG